MTDEQTKTGAVLLPWSCYWREGICGPPPSANIVSFNGEDVLPIAYVPNPDDRYAIIHKHNACVKRIWDAMVAASGPKLSDYSRVVQIPGNTLDLAPDCSWAHSDAELAKDVRELASTPQPPPEQAGSVPPLANVRSPTPYTTLDCVATDGCKASVQAVAPAPKETP